MDEKDIVGQKFGKLTAIGFEDYDNSRNVRWRFLCECGNETVTRLSRAMRGDVKSCGCLSKFAKGVAAFNKLFDTYKRAAKMRENSFELDKEKFRELVTSPCHYCGKEPSQIASNKGMNGEFLYNGIDRLNNDLGYIEGNCVSACGFCNRAKNYLTEKEFLDRIKNIAEYRNL